MWRKNSQFKIRNVVVEEHSDEQKKRWSLIVEVPIEQLRKIAQTRSVTSLASETRHFTGTTTFHGLFRLYRGKIYGKLFWSVIVIAACGLFCGQLFTLITILTSRPTVSKVSFILPENGMDFPVVTLCNYNPMKSSYIKAINATGQFSTVLLGYIAKTYMQIQAIYDDSNATELQQGHLAYENYTKSVNPNFTVNQFFKDAGFTCEEMLKMCTFGGKQFQCCDNATPLLTDLGLCYQFNLNKNDTTSDWMQRQNQAGIFHGLQIVADYHNEEAYGITSDEHYLKPIFTNTIERGFRFYVHPETEKPYLSSEGISISPNSHVYAVVHPSRFILLRKNNWGNCTSEWPKREGYDRTDPYSASSCKALCIAKYFYQKCSCSPFLYNIFNQYETCTPYESYRCVAQKFQDQVVAVPDCSECAVECDRWSYQSFNSYGVGFSRGAVQWLHKYNSSWTYNAITTNFAYINIFFRDMTYTEYYQMKATGLTETLSDIGGNMGMFLGASVVTVIEVMIYLMKISWIGLSRRRREYLAAKKRRETPNKPSLQHQPPSPKDVLMKVSLQSSGDQTAETSTATACATPVLPCLKRKNIETANNSVFSSSEHSCVKQDSVDYTAEYKNGTRRQRIKSEIIVDPDKIQLIIDMNKLKRKRIRRRTVCCANPAAKCSSRIAAVQTESSSFRHPHVSNTLVSAPMHKPSFGSFLTVPEGDEFYKCYAQSNDQMLLNNNIK